MCVIRSRHNAQMNNTLCIKFQTNDAETSFSITGQQTLTQFYTVFKSAMPIKITHSNFMKITLLLIYNILTNALDYPYKFVQILSGVASSQTLRGRMTLFLVHTGHYKQKIVRTCGIISNK